MLEGNVFRAANFDEADPYDMMILKQLKSQYWDPDVFPLTNDRAVWQALDPEMRTLVMRVFTGLTMLDTLQGEIGAESMMRDSTSDGEAAVWGFILMTEISIHALSYSRVFQTLDEQGKGKSAFVWSDSNEYLQNKARIMRKYYAEGDPHKKKVATVMLESFLFYSGFFLALWLHGQAMLTNTGDMIKTIIRDEAVHGAYAGAKFQQGIEGLSGEERGDLETWVYDLLDDLYANEIKYTEDLYADYEELIPEVKVFLRYNANRALMNLGYDPLFPHEDPNAMVMNGLSLDSATHDFFSQKGAAYSMANVVASTDDTWNFELVDK